MGIMDDIRAEVGSYETRSAELTVNGKTHTVYAKPITSRDRIALDRKNLVSIHEAMVETLILKCADADGKLIFTVADKPILISMAVSDIEGLFLGLFGAKHGLDLETEQDAEERAGNS